MIAKSLVDPWIVVGGWPSLRRSTLSLHACFRIPTPWYLHGVVSLSFLYLACYIVCRETDKGTRPNLSQFQSLKIRRSTFVNTTNLTIGDFEALKWEDVRSGARGENTCYITVAGRTGAMQEGKQRRRRIRVMIGMAMTSDTFSLPV